MLEIRLLGRFEVRREGEIVEIPSRPSQSLFAYLLLNMGSHQRREKLAGLLWPDSDETKARRQLRQALWRLRKLVGSEYFLADKITIGFDPDANYSLDVEVIKDDAVWSRARDDLIQNLSDYAGELLPGFYDDWVMLERERLSAVFDLQMQLLMNRLLDDQRWLDAILCSECWIARGEAPEPAYRALMIAHHGLRDTPRVTEVFHRCVDALREELGVDPSAETSRLYERLLTEDKPLEVQPPTPRHNLWQSPTSFIGREDELAQVRERLGDPSCRLLTLMGPGGIGKTRIALQAAHELLPKFAQGVFFVPLAHVDSIDLLEPTIANEIGFSFYEGEEPSTQLISYLQAKEMLLILDNFEHLFEGALLLAGILEASPGVKILATSRERLNLYGEWLLEISGMTYPSKAEVIDLEGFSAIQLFLDRAKRISPSFTPSKEDHRSIARICQRVEGTPLAIELSSAWTQSLTCKEIANEIEDNLDFLTTSMQDMPERQRSLRASFDHSWSLLSDEERVVLQKLAVFRGGFKRDAAKVVAEASLSNLSAFVDKSLVRRSDSGRYEIHPLLWQFIAEELCKTPEEWQLTKELHSKYFAEFLHKQSGYLRGVRQDEALTQVGDEIENVRLILQWLVGQNAIVELGKVLDVLRVFFDVRGWYQEGENSFRQVVECLERTLPALDKWDTETALIFGKALTGQAWLCHRLYLPEKAQALLEKSLSVSRKFGLKDIEADSLDTLAVIALRQGEYQKAKRLFQESLTIWRELENIWWQAAELSCLAHVARSLGRSQEAEQYSEKALSTFRESGNQWGIAGALNTRGSIARERQEYDRAERCYQEGLEISREISYKYGIARASLGLAQVAYQLGELDRAREHCRTSLAVFTELGKKIETPTVLTVLGDIHAAQEDDAEAKQCFKRALEIASDIEATPEFLRALVGIAPLLVREGEEKKAIHLLRFAATQSEIKSSDQEKASKLLKDLISEHPLDGEVAKPECIEDMGFSEIVDRFLGNEEIV